MNIEKILKDNKKSITNERLVIFDYVKNSHIFSSNDLLNNFSNIWRASIFRVIKLFLDLWIIRKVNIWKKGDSYELDKENHHHEHMNCSKCWQIINFESENICKILFEEAKKIWFIIKEHSINIMWVCNNCL